MPLKETHNFTVIASGAKKLLIEIVHLKKKKIVSKCPKCHFYSRDALLQEFHAHFMNELVPDLCLECNGYHSYKTAPQWWGC